MVYKYPPDWTNTTQPADTGLIELTELIKAIRNRCNIYLILQRSDRENVEPLIPTLLEDLYNDAQTMIDEHCVEKDA